MDKLATLSYYFQTQPDANFQFTTITLIIGIALIIFGIIWELYRKKIMTDKVARKILRPYPGKLIRYGFIVLLLLAVREAGIAYLSMRIWWFVLLAFVLFSFLRLLFTYKKESKLRHQKLKKAGKEDKYIPKKKK